MQLFCSDATMFLIFFAHENMKKLASKVAHNQPNFFSNANRSKSSPNVRFQIHKNLPPQDFSIMTLLIAIDAISRQ